MYEILIFVFFVSFRNKKLIEGKLIKDKLIYGSSILLGFIFFFYFFSELRYETQYFRDYTIKDMIMRYALTKISITLLYFINILYFLACVYLSTLFLGIGQIREKSRYILIKSIIPLWLILTSHAYIYRLKINNVSYNSDISLLSTAIAIAIPLIFIFVFFYSKRVKRLFIEVK